MNFHFPSKCLIHLTLRFAKCFTVGAVFAINLSCTCHLSRQTKFKNVGSRFTVPLYLTKIIFEDFVVCWHINKN